MVEVEARILSPPAIHFQVGKKVPYRGTWYVPKGDLFSETEGEFFFGVLAVNCEIPNEQLLEAADQLKDYGSALGLQLNHNKNIEHVHTNDLEASKHLTNAFKELVRNMSEGAKPVAKKFVLVVLGNSTLYAAVKTVAEKVAGIITQCVQEGKLSTVKQEVLWPNICLKLNAKLGGCNNTVSSDKNVNAIFINALFIGIDVNHPAPGDNHKPSIAACVASFDKNAFRYRARVSVQMNPDGAVARKEVVTDLKAMVLDHLKFYYGKQRRLPDRIIVYRDGVGEGQFKEVQAKEVDAIKQACRSASPNYQPPVTFIIVQKRHHTRFLPIFDKQPINVNVPPGTTVENGITQPGHLNFFLCSHQGPIGTSRPAHYHVLCKESKHTLQQLQQLTYDLCHLVARCTRSMSIPSPVYYAHLAAFRAKNHIKGFLRINPNGQYTDAVTVHRNIANEMYFV
ncbi:hypothetical protein HPB51_005796 [Rhipicephalus microplus]|uniref:Piwi domain-containing protein n=1 Tax=Rhipicephalus microplus TaxID=6941 RepID=A0A9J6EMB7_RHIMP|nr:hypothetical protein HPB51_005796 [Rhipicephalus microplus]